MIKKSRVRRQLLREMLIKEAFEQKIKDAIKRDEKRKGADNEQRAD
jgi:hypothetical protein